MKKKLIAIWGLCGNGKSNLTVNLAMAMAQKTTTVCAFGTNTIYGELQKLTGDTITVENSLVAAMNHPDLKIDKSKCRDTLYILSMPDDASALDMPDISNQAAMDLVVKVKDRFDYVLCDCEDNINEAFAMTALAVSDQVLLLIKPTVKCSLWLEAYSPVIEYMGLKNKIIYIMSGDMGIVGKNEFCNRHKIICKVTIPYTKEFSVYENSGKPIAATDDVFVKKSVYMKSILKIAELIKEH